MSIRFTTLENMTLGEIEALAVDGNRAAKKFLDELDWPLEISF